MGETSASGSNPTHVEQASDRELVVTRTIDAPVHLVYRAWSEAELFKRWWAPKSMGMRLLSCEMDVRTGGGYRLAFGEDEASAFSFFGKYLEVVPNARMVWTNEEGDGAITTVTFEEKDGRTLLVYRELFPSKEALEAEGGGVTPEQFEQLEALLATL